MEDINRIKKRYELPKMARDFLNEDYINRRADAHNKWLAENEDSWRMRRRNIPYPTFAPYPTDEEIVKAASNLYNFIYADSEEKEATSPEAQPANTVSSPCPAPVAEIVDTSVLEPLSDPVASSKEIIDVDVDVGVGVDVDSVTEHIDLGYC